jgi:hypothetical protein
MACFKAEFETSACFQSGTHETTRTLTEGVVDKVSLNISEVSVKLLVFLLRMGVVPVSILCLKSGCCVNYSYFFPSFCKKISREHIIICHDSSLS